MKSGAWWDAIQARLLRGDPTAPLELAEEALPELEQYLRSHFPTFRDESLFSESAADAIMAHVKAPDAFVRDKRSLLGYLKMSAKGDFLNAWDRQRRLRKLRKEISLSSVELGLSRRKEHKTTKGAEPDHEREAAALIRSLFPNPTDLKIAVLIAEGERSTSTFAKILGIADLHVSEQRKIVKRHKDRIKKMLEREGRKGDA
jgi:RNA polymerase sigma-70 factor (ECF subfamily)